MARLVLSLDGQSLAEYNMSKERYTVGRLPDNDIRIDNAAVSGHHALIINILNDSFLEDLNSTNGTYVNGRIIKKHALQHGDSITVGHHTLRFVESEAEEPADEFEKTMVISPRDASRMQMPAAALAPSPSAAAQPYPNATLPRARLQVLSGQFAGRELELVKTLTTLGRPGVQVAAITKIDHRPVGAGRLGPIVQSLRQLYFDVVRGKVAKYRRWCAPVYASAGAANAV